MKINKLIKFIIGVIFIVVAIKSILTGETAGIATRGSYYSVTFNNNPVEFLIGISIWAVIGFGFFYDSIKKENTKKSNK